MTKKKNQPKTGTSKSVAVSGLPPHATVKKAAAAKTPPIAPPGPIFLPTNFTKSRTYIRRTYTKIRKKTLTRMKLSQIEFLGLTENSEQPAQLETSQIQSSKGGYVSVFHVPDKASLQETLKQAGQAPHAGHPTVAVVSPSVINQPDLRQSILHGYSDFVVEDQGDPRIERLVELLGKTARSLLLKTTTLERPSAPAQMDSEAELTDLSARLRDTSGRLDARKLSDLLGISMTDLATKVCGVTKQNLSQSPTSTGIQDKLQPLEDVAQLLHWCSGDEAKLRAWLNRPNRDFPEVDGKTPSPVDLILRGHAAIVARKVHNLRTGHPA